MGGGTTSLGDQTVEGSERQEFIENEDLRQELSRVIGALESTIADRKTGKEVEETQDEVDGEESPTRVTNPSSNPPAVAAKTQATAANLMKVISNLKMEKKARKYI